MPFRYLDYARLGLDVVRCRATGRSVPLSVTIAITHRCTVTCRYCACPQHPSPELSTTAARRLIDELVRAGTRKIGFTGGEPLVRKDIYDLVELSVRAGAVAHLVTNAEALDSWSARRLRVLDALMVSLEGPQEVHAGLRPGTSIDVLEKIRIALAAGVRVVALMTLVKQNVQHIQYVLDRGRELGFSVMFSLLHEHLHARDDLADMALTQSEKQAALEEILRAQAQGFPVGNSPSMLRFARDWPATRTPVCYAGKLYFVADANGDIYPCWPAMGRMEPLNALKDGIPAALERARSFKCEGCTFSCHHEMNFLLSFRPDALWNALKMWRTPFNR